MLTGRGRRDGQKVLILVQFVKKCPSKRPANFDESDYFVDVTYRMLLNEIDLISRLIHARTWMRWAVNGSKQLTSVKSAAAEVSIKISRTNDGRRRCGDNIISRS